MNINRESTVLGGAGNVVHNLKKLGARVDVISVVGNCSISDKLKNLLKEIKVETNFLITESKRITSKKSRIIASQQQVVRYDRENSDDIDSESQNSIFRIFEDVIDQYEVVLLSDYGKGVLTKNLTQRLINTSNKHNKRVLVDPKGKDYSKYQNAFLLTPNKKEASEASKIDIVDDSSLLQAIKCLKNELNLNVSVITLSENGVAVFDDDLKIYQTVAKEVFDVTGAGDTVLASLGYAIASGSKIDEAIKFSNLAAGVVVGKIGSASATHEEINNYESNLSKISSSKYIKTSNEIHQLSLDLKSQGKNIIFTNGCFDILHAGHISYLEEAKSLGDILIVGLNSDNSVSNLKGNNRPINSERDRASMLAALEAVDYVVIFNEDSPYNLIKKIMPKILVKGGDYNKDEIVGQDLAEETKIVKFIEGKSSTKIINKIRNINS